MEGIGVVLNWKGQKNCLIITITTIVIIIIVIIVITVIIIHLVT